MYERKTITILAASIVTLGATLALSGCTVIKKQLSDAWSVTYEVVLEGPATTELHDVRYLDAPGRGEASAPVSKGTVTTTNTVGEPEKASWKTQVVVTAEHPAEVTASAPTGTRISCRILLDDEKTLVAQSSEAGGSVTCRADTPKFDKR